MYWNVNLALNRRRCGITNHAQKQYDWTCTSTISKFMQISNKLAESYLFMRTIYTKPFELTVLYFSLNHENSHVLKPENCKWSYRSKLICNKQRDYILDYINNMSFPGAEHQILGDPPLATYFEYYKRTICERRAKYRGKKFLKRLIYFHQVVRTIHLNWKLHCKCKY